MQNKSTLKESLVIPATIVLFSIMALFAVVRGLILYLVSFIILKKSFSTKHHNNVKEDNTLTSQVQDAADDKNIKVFLFDNNIEKNPSKKDLHEMSVFSKYDESEKTANIYLGSALVNKSRLNNDEIKAVCLHEYGLMQNPSYKGVDMSLKSISTYSIHIFFISVSVLFLIFFPSIFAVLSSTVAMMIGSPLLASGLFSKYFMKKNILSDSYTKSLGYEKQLQTALIKIKYEIKERQCDYLNLSSKNCKLLNSDAKELKKNKRVQKLMKITRPIDKKLAKMLGRNPDPKQLIKSLNVLNKYENVIKKNIEEKEDE